MVPSPVLALLLQALCCQAVHCRHDVRTPRPSAFRWRRRRAAAGGPRCEVSRGGACAAARDCRPCKGACARSAPRGNAGSKSACVDPRIMPSTATCVGCAPGESARPRSRAREDSRRDGHKNYWDVHGAAFWACGALQNTRPDDPGAGGQLARPLGRAAVSLVCTRGRLQQKGQPGEQGRRAPAPPRPIARAQRCRLRGAFAARLSSLPRGASSPCSTACEWCFRRAAWLACRAAGETAGQPAPSAGGGCDLTISPPPPPPRLCSHSHAAASCHLLPRC
jgi:hypothetical protein